MAEGSGLISRVWVPFALPPVLTLPPSQEGLAQQHAGALAGAQGGLGKEAQIHGGEGKNLPRIFPPGMVQFAVRNTYLVVSLFLAQCS